MMILIWVILGYGIYYLVKGKDTNLTSINRKEPLDILKERFVNDEIDEETYLKMKETLNKQ